MCAYVALHERKFVDSCTRTCAFVQESLSFFLDTCVHAFMRVYGRGYIGVCMFVRGAAPNSPLSLLQDIYREQSLKIREMLLGTVER